ncbi:toll/interleukin-1 receptor domain-containing protein [Luteibacter sp. dw_328]|uniref:toll/interleukin-1 receptor domain-containing protein n=1 Tax=Luteibacter sp. dw_328 TaxID=2719796 RepID=UPI0031F2DFCF
MSTEGFMGPDYRYRAFISYSHQDTPWAAWLHRALETYAIPDHLVGQLTAAGVIPRRLTPVFRDRDELASAGDLGRTVNAALAQSECLLVICSPHAASSRWVNEEVLSFKRLGRDERIFCLIVAGEPNASDLPGREAEECLVPALRHRLDGAPIEPIAADVRQGSDGKLNALIKLVAGMLCLGFDDLKQREMHRRMRRVTILAAVALVVMAVTTGLAISAFISRHAAVVASHVAERRQKEAEDLVSFMLGDLNDKLAQVSRLDIMEAVDNQAMKYFQAQPLDEVTERALEQRASALEKIGSVRLDQGQLAAAMTSYRAALAVATRLGDAAPTNVDRQLALADVWAYIGMTQWRQGKLDDAQRSFASAQATLQRAAVHAPGKTQLAFQRATLDNNIGHVMEARGELDQAATQYRHMLAQMQDLVTGQPHNPDWLEYLGSAYNNLGKLALMRGDLAEAVAQYGADERIQSGLSASDPKNMSRRDNLLTVHAILGRTQALTGDVAAGMVRLQQAVDMATQLGALDPSNTDFQDHAALYATQLARLRRLTGDLPAANALTSKALSIYAELTRRDPDNAAWQREYAEAQLEHAAQLGDAGQQDDARDHAAMALRALDPLMAKLPDDRSTLLAGVAARLSLAAVTTDTLAARQLRTEALDRVQAAKSGQGDPRLQALRAETLLALTRRPDATPVIQRLWASGYRDAGLLRVLRREHIDYPVNQAFQHELLVATGGGPPQEKE